MAELNISEANKEDIGVWRNLQRYPAWKRVVKELQLKIANAEKVINLIGGDRKLEYTKRDLAILQKNAYLDLIEMPEEMIRLLQGTGTEQTENLDAYSDNKSEPELPDDTDL